MQSRLSTPEISTKTVWHAGRRTDVEMSIHLIQRLGKSGRSLPNRCAKKFSALGIASFMNATFVFVSTKAANLPYAETDRNLPRRVFAVRPSFAEALQTYTVALGGGVHDPLSNSIVRAFRSLGHRIANFEYLRDSIVQSLRQVHWLFQSRCQCAVSNRKEKR
jgi:hypothetical protein